MKKIYHVLGVALVLAVAFALVGCQSKESGMGKPVPQGVTEPSAASSATSSVSETGTAQDAETKASEWDRIPMVMVNGELYYDTGKESTMTVRCGNMDGEITSTVDGSEIPSENNQSNFGTGFGYQYGNTDTTIEIFMNEKWFVFEQREGSGDQGTITHQEISGES